MALGIFIIAMKADFNSQKQHIDLTEEQEVVKMEDVTLTDQEDKPAPPPPPKVPVEVPKDKIIEDQDINFNSEMNINDTLELPPSPENDEKEEQIFIAVQQMPELKGGILALQKKVSYPEKARKAGIEGRVIIQFIVNEQGKVENPRVIRGIGGGCDKAALEVVKKAEFEPGRQRGEAVRVQFSLPITFRLQN